MAAVEDDLTGEVEAPEGEEGGEDEAPEKPKSKAQLTFEAVKAHIETGKSKAESFEAVAGETGRSVATITTAYYRWARANEPDEIRSQPRGPRAPGSAPAGGKAKPAATRAVSGGVASQLKATLKEIGKLHVQLDRLAEQVVQMERDAKGIADARRALGIK